MSDNRKRTELLCSFSSLAGYRQVAYVLRKARTLHALTERELSSLVLQYKCLAVFAKGENKDSKSKLYQKSKSEQKRRG